MAGAGVGGGMDAVLGLQPHHPVDSPSCGVASGRKHGIGRDQPVPVCHHGPDAGRSVRGCGHGRHRDSCWSAEP
ncbi:hypothetical protein ACFFX0_04525 [Citricoccus parietis]|uniref:Uncharacterized protein n=1 Tax=Citricoccus parietis TaxID=592307 RepID=A0ABV5FV04_9MICC